MKIFARKINDLITNFEFIPSFDLPKDIPISTPLTFAFIGQDLVLTKKNNGWWDILGGKIENGENWIDALKRESLEEAGVIIDNISIVGYIVATNSGNISNIKFPEKSILPVTISFVQEVKKEWIKYETLERNYFNKKRVKKLLLERSDNSQLLEIFEYVLSCFDKKKYNINFEFIPGEGVMNNLPNTQSMVFLKTTNNKFLIVRDFDEDFFSLPGGGCNMDEDGMQCAIREVREEAQVDVENIKLIGTVVVRLSDGDCVLSTSTQQRYLADALNIKPFVNNAITFNEENSEIVERKEVEIEELKELVKLLKNKTGEEIIYCLKKIL